MPTKRAYILNFHGLGRHRRTLERGEKNYWLSVEAFERWLDLIEGVNASGRAYVRITFDDGNLSDFDIALPSLVARGLAAQFFILTDRLDKEGSLSVRHLQALRDAGMKIATHGTNHLDWTSTPDHILERDITYSRKRLEDFIGERIYEVSIPYNRYNQRVLRCLKRAGMRTVYTSDGGTYRETAWIKPRTCVRNDTPQSEIATMLTIGEPLQRVMRRKMRRFRATYITPR